MFGPSPTIRIEVEQNTVFLHPSADASVIPSDDADQIVRGAVVLSLPQPKKLSSLTVVFRGDQSYNGGPGYPYEEEHVLFKELEIGLQDEMLPVGESVYEFTFIVPSNTPEQQRCSYGRTVYYLSATAKVPGTFASDIKSKIVPIWVLGNPAPPGEFPEFSELLTSYQEPLGPVSITVSAPHLTVSALMLFDISLLSPPPGLVLKKLTGFINQSFEVSYREGNVVRPLPVRHVLFETDESSTQGPPQPAFGKAGKEYYSASLPGGQCLDVDAKVGLPPVTEGEEWKFKKLTRLPNDDRIRPTTLEFLKSRVKASHTVGVEIQWEGEEGKRLAATITKPIHIVSCCAMRDSMHLPAYSKDPNQGRAKKAVNCDCVCGSSFLELVEQDEKDLYPDRVTPAPDFVPLASPESKTPAVGADRGPVVMEFKQRADSS